MSRTIMRSRKAPAVGMLSVLVVACSGGSTTGTGGGGDGGAATSAEGGNGGGGGSSSGGGGGCGAQAIPPALSGGCAPRFVTPTACEEIDLSGGKTYEVAWTADGTGCETPWKLCAAGNPVSDPNSACAQLSTNVEAGISSTGGIYNLSAADLEGLTSDDGVYHLLVASFYDSHNGSLAIRVKR